MLQVKIFVNKNLHLAKESFQIFGKHAFLLIDTPRFSAVFFMKFLRTRFQLLF